MYTPYLREAFISTYKYQYALPVPCGYCGGFKSRIQQSKRNFFSWGRGGFGALICIIAGRGGCVVSDV